jgi:hypothetical protein
MDVPRERANSHAIRRTYGNCNPLGLNENLGPPECVLVLEGISKVPLNRELKVKKATIISFPFDPGSSVSRPHITNHVVQHENAAEDGIKIR